MQQLPTMSKRRTCELHLEPGSALIFYQLPLDTWEVSVGTKFPWDPTLDVTIRFGLIYQDDVDDDLVGVLAVNVKTHFADLPTVVNLSLQIQALILSVLPNTKVQVHEIIVDVHIAADPELIPEAVAKEA